MAQQRVISSQALAGDIDTLRSLPASTLASISGNSSKSNSDAPLRNAVETLEITSISSTDPDHSQALAKAYIKAMRKDVLGIDGNANEEMGNRLDELRGRAEGISGALGQVKV
jgi:uncharacterized protein involved in exopolysaccharide biosynthesis